MDSKKLEILMTAIDLGSFTKASEVVGYTQSGLTHMMDALEREVGFSLLQRDHNGIQLSPQGRQLMPAIREFLQANANLENQINAISEQKKEVIRIAAYASIAMHWMPELLYRYKRVCPEVSVDLRMVDNALEPYELLESGQTDVIFASRQNYSFCDWTPLYNEKMYAILPKDYPLNGRTTFPLEEFSGQDFLMPYGRFDIDVNAAMDSVGVKLNASVSRVDDETVIRMVGHGLGVTMMTELMIRGRTDDVLCVPVDPPRLRDDSNGYGESIARLSNMLGGGVMVQRFGDLIRGRRSTKARIEESFVTPTLSATPGDLSLVMPKRILDGIIEMIYALDKIAPGTADDDTLLYGVEVKFYNMEVEIDENLETCHKGLFVIGDCSGVTHSLSHASASGVYVARYLEQEYFNR